jgi:hypothetical protein
MLVVLAIIAKFLALALISRYALWIAIVGYMILVISYVFGTARSPRRLTTTTLQEQTRMRTSSALRARLIAVLALAGAASASPAHADEGGINFSVIKAGLVIGGSAGSGTLFFHGQRYPLSIGGVSYGFTFGASETRFRGTVSNIRSPADVSGVYAAGNVGAAVGRGAQAIMLTNQHGAVLTLSGNSVGAIVSADLNGLVITVK